MSDHDLLDYTRDLARLEQALRDAGRVPFPDPATIDGIRPNPTLVLLSLDWSGLTDYDPDRPGMPPPRGEAELVLVWRRAPGIEPCARPAGPLDLLALKMVAEERSAAEVAAEHEVPVGVIDRAMEQAFQEGLLLRPPSRLTRPEGAYAPPLAVAPERVRAPIFTLQWHITQACDLHCRHCYDRSSKPPLPFHRAIAVLDDLRDFRQTHFVPCQVTFTGGNPLLYPRFPELYRAASDRGFRIAILGNPASREAIRELIAIRQPEFFQVSLEGLEAHNDHIRGTGHFRRVLAFLDILREEGVYSMVMLTLTAANFRQVLPLAERLRDRADMFVFNRLSLTGEGAKLAAVPVAEYPDFLQAYLDATTTNPVLALKDNFINLIREERGLPPFGGCTGFGCGAAFNFVSLLPDGEVHACRKFHSPIGNIFRQRLADIYHSEAAIRHRLGSLACRNCRMKPVCGGCQAVTASFGLDIERDRDPYCFLKASFMEEPGVVGTPRG